MTQSEVATFDSTLMRREVPGDPMQAIQAQMPQMHVQQRVQHMQVS
jgi:hypothetical protein